MSETTTDACRPEIVALDDLSGTPHADAFEEHRPRAVRLQLDAGELVPAHRHPGYDVVLHLLSGRIELTLDDETHHLAAGELARFSGECDIEPHAVEPSTALVVFAPAVEE